jgi:hypothetical protein
VLSGKRIAVLEMKGERLGDNADTEYKQAVLRLMTEAFEIEQHWSLARAAAWCLRVVP